MSTQSTLLSCAPHSTSPSSHFADAGSFGKWWSVTKCHREPCPTPSPVLFLSHFLPFVWKLTASGCVEEFGNKDPQTEGVLWDLSELNLLLPTCFLVRFRAVWSQAMRQNEL